MTTTIKDRKFSPHRIERDASGVKSETNFPIRIGVVLLAAFMMGCNGRKPEVIKVENQAGPTEVVIAKSATISRIVRGQDEVSYSGNSAKFTITSFPGCGIMRITNESTGDSVVYSGSNIEIYILKR